MEVKSDHRSKFSNLSNGKEEACTSQGFNGIQTRDLRDTGAMLNQLSCEATYWERGHFVEFISTRVVKNTNMNFIRIYFTQLLYYYFYSNFETVLLCVKHKIAVGNLIII